MFRVALYYPTKLGLWQDVVRGVFRFARPQQPWVFSMATTANPRTMLKWEPDAVIGQFETRESLRLFQGLHIPIVDTSFSFDHPTVPRVRFDDVAIGRLAGEYFISKGFENLAFVGRDSIAFERERGIGFAAVLNAAGIQPLESPPIDPPRVAGDDLGPIPARWRRWLSKTPTPLGLFAAVDSLALRVSELCRDQQIRVPDNVGLLGVNDSLICQLAFPPLSSLQLPAESMGYQAAQMLSEWLQSGRRPQDEVVLPPSRIVSRQSTDIYATHDPLLRHALELIRSRAHQRLTVGSVAHQLNVSRRSLERTFQTLLKRSPAAEIRRVRLEMARKLLLDTDRQMPQIAKACGFRDSRQMATAFRQLSGMTPSNYRKRFGRR